MLSVTWSFGNRLTTVSRSSLFNLHLLELLSVSGKDSHKMTSCVKVVKAICDTVQL